MKGMRTMRKRLANRESKMATAAMADADVDNANRNFSQPLHKAVLANKCICPISCCVENMLFFERNAGLARHFCTVHKKPVTEQDLLDSTSIMKRMYGEETLNYIWYLSEKSKV